MACDGTKNEHCQAAAVPELEIDAKILKVTAGGPLGHSGSGFRAEQDTDRKKNCSTLQHTSRQQSTALAKVRVKWVRLHGSNICTAIENPLEADLRQCDPDLQRWEQAAAVSASGQPESLQPAGVRS